MIELSDAWINLDHVAYAENLGPDRLRIHLTIVLPTVDEDDGSMGIRDVLDLEGADAATMRAALHGQRWRRPGEPGPLQVELVAMVRRYVNYYGDSVNGGAIEEGMTRDARALLARVDAAAPPAADDVMEGDTT